MNIIIFFIIIFWFVGANVLYIWKVRKYMKKYGLINIDDASICEKNIVNEFYLICLIGWLFYLIISIKEKRPL